MIKRMTDDEIHDYVYKKIFDDLDNIEAKSLFDPEKNEPGDSGTKMEGVEISIKPLMEGSAEPLKGEETPEEEEEEDRLKGISDISPLMSQLHGKR